MSAYHQQSPEQLEVEIQVLHTSMGSGSWDRRAACALQIQAILFELAKREQNAQTEAMLGVSKSFWLSWAVQG
jgi:hypothetical protein